MGTVLFHQDPKSITIAAMLESNYFLGLVLMSPKIMHLFAEIFNRLLKHEEYPGTKQYDEENPL